MELPDGVTFAASHLCWDCGRKVKNGAHGKRRPNWRHACALRWLSRARWRGHLEGWHEGYRFGIENYDDGMVQLDVDDYGSGWAAHMRGGVVVLSDDAKEAGSDG
jgi:hypothetical protein